MIGHTISMRSAGVIAAQASGSLSPRLPTHSAAVAARAVSLVQSCPEGSWNEGAMNPNSISDSKSMRKELPSSECY